MSYCVTKLKQTQSHTETQVIHSLVHRKRFHVIPGRLNDSEFSAVMHSLTHSLHSREWCTNVYRETMWKTTQVKSRTRQTDNNWTFNRRQFKKKENLMFYRLIAMKWSMEEWHEQSDLQLACRHRLKSATLI